MVEEAQTMTSAKDEILQRVRAALSNSKTERESDYAEIPRRYQIASELDEQARLDLFVDRLHDYGASVYNCGEDAIGQTVGSAVRERNVKKILTGKDFPGEWIPAGFDFSADHGLDHYQINSFDGVITGCALAIAETGTIVLRHADEEPRRAISLIPDYHLCIVFARQVVETVPQGVRQMASMGNVPLTTISGPSATSDIEMTRIKGVHGPRTLDVVLVS